MKCVICKKTDWENVDDYRIKPQNMAMCSSCGFITYPEKYKKKEDVIKYYRKQYRPAPSVGNLYTGQRKLHYHEHFLDPVIKEWVETGKKDPVIFEVGAAFGLFLIWWKKIKDEDGQFAFPKADLGGTELTLSFKRNAYHEYGLRLQDDFDDNKKYDIITTYKVAEHMFDIDIELARYKKALKENGYLYISVPIWFEKLNNFGIEGFDLEYYYHPDHVNVWSKIHFEKLLNDSGFKIVRENHWTYDSTYLCKVGEEKRHETLPGPDRIKKLLEQIRLANECLTKRDFAGAVAAYPNFPIARRANYEFTKKEAHKKGYEQIVKEHVESWLAIDPNSFEAYSFAADLALRYNKYDDCLKHLDEFLKRRPKCEVGLQNLANCYRAMAKKAQSEQERIQHFAKARQVMKYMKDHCLQGFGTAVTWMYADNAHIPIPGEN